jgi:uncharacterized protein (TIGR02145 family)
MKQLFLSTAFTLLVGISLNLYSQVAINSDNNSPDNTAMLDVKSTEKGMLVPRMTKTQREAIVSPATGLLVYQTDNIPGFYYYTGYNWYSGTYWVSLTGSGPGGNSPSMCFDRDGNAYPTFTIWGQTWMAENLRVTHYRNGEAIPNVTSNASWEALSTGAYCWYNNDQATNAKYGVLYNWYTVNDSRGLCPQGWHVPTGADWNTLTAYLGGASVAGGKMKSVSALWESPNTDATNNSGFSGLPGGLRWDDGTSNQMRMDGYWWSSTEYSSNEVWFCDLYCCDGSAGFSAFDKRCGFSVRCLRD